MKVRFGIVILCLMVMQGCAAYQRYSRNEDCEKTLKAYRNMVRWMEVEKAAISVVDADQRATYAQAAEALRRRGVTMVDARELAHECRPERGTAEATLEFDYFILPDNRLKTLTDRQKWVYREEDKARPELIEGWKLTTPLPAFK